MLIHVIDPPRAFDKHAALPAVAQTVERPD